MDIRTYLKDCFQDKAIVRPDQADIAPAEAIVLHHLVPDSETSIAKVKMPIAAGVLEPEKRDTLSISDVFPPRVKISKAGQEIPKVYIPVADWNGRDLRIAIQETSLTVSIRNTLFSGLPLLLGIGAQGQEGASILRQKMSLGLTKERQILEANAEKNRKYAEKQYEEIRKFLDSAARQERIAKGLEALEQGELDIFAKTQWEDLQSLIPAVLQDIYIKDDFIHAITNPIVVSGVFIGACRIQIMIATAKVMVYAVEPATRRNGHCHPHVQNDGNPCWGNLERNVADMAAKRDYYGLVNAALRLLHQYVHEDAYAKLHEWGHVKAKPEDGLSCQKYGPSHSYEQMRICLTCVEECHVDINDKISYCISMRAPGDCVSCQVGNERCRQYQSRFTNCQSYQSQVGIAYCLLKCTVECPLIDKAKDMCKSENLPAKEPCPAKSLCRRPCERKDDVQDAKD